VTARFGIGDAPQRREDVRCVTGRGRSLDDLVFDGLTDAVILASQEQWADVHGLCVHALRATATTNALAHNADIAKVQEGLGHANMASFRPFSMGNCTSFGCLTSSLGVTTLRLVGYGPWLRATPLHPPHSVGEDGNRRHQRPIKPGLTGGTGCTLDCS